MSECIYTLERRDFKHTRGRDVEIDCPYVPVRARKERKAEIKILERVRGGGVDTCIIQNIYYVFGSIDTYMYARETFN